MKILLFAGLAEACGARTVECAVPAAATVADLRAAAEAAHPALRGRPYAVAVNARRATESESIPSGAEIAFLPPVSGG
ncbi:MAG: MoaD/ThiS family protein [Planctomycetota bacterium]|nr:MoaD/ThiS family protein [Planctomycetota bacterium]